MIEPVLGIRRLCLALVAESGPGRLRGLLGPATAMERVLWLADEPTAGIGIFPPGIDEPRAVSEAVDAVRRLPGLRLVLHEGIVTLDGEFQGPGIEDIRALAAHALTLPPNTVLLSSRVYTDLRRVSAASGYAPAPASPVPAYLAAFR
ncbi:hypothetical protein ABGB12_32195 [Actinocorallia sp. B10E7]|uniref:hypothetical protein n=1 Tax=Actinocorallia sp. B10E7 TaxID=3153558 RepID=UPI00325CABA9